MSMSWMIIDSSLYHFFGHFPYRPQEQSWLRPESTATLNPVSTVAYWSIRNSEALQPGWVKTKWPVLWKQPLKVTVLFPMGRAMSPVRPLPPVCHLQETKKSEYFHNLPAPTYLLWNSWQDLDLCLLVDLYLEIRCAWDRSTMSQYETFRKRIIIWEMELNDKWH